MSLWEFIRQNVRYIALVVIVVALVTAGIFAARALLPTSVSSENSTSSNAPSAPVSPYDWTCLERNNGRYSFVVDGQVRSRLGVDVSENQHEIDWNAVAGDGIEFALIRLGYRGSTEGGLFVDDNFWSNIEGARAAGLDIGVYFFSQADNVDEAIEEAELVVSQLEGIKLEYPVGFDSEVVNFKGAEAPTANLTRDEMTAIAQAFCKRVKEAGYDAMIYGNAYDLARYKFDDMADWPIWWAEYGASSPSTTSVIDFWQYSNSGMVAGISTVVDLNLDLRNVPKSTG